MNIEVTRNTFEILFDQNHFDKTERTELANKHFYENSEIEQKGIEIQNFVSNTTQYYLIDINV